MTWPPPPIDVLNRQDATPAHHQHPKDHDDLQVAVNAILAVLGDGPQGGEVDLTVRLLLVQQMVADLQTQINGLSGSSLHQAVADYISSLNLANLALTHYVHYQRQTADSWNVVHNLGFDPLVSVVRDSPDQVIMGFDLAYSVDHMSLTLGFSQAITGRALLSN